MNLPGELVNGEQMELESQYLSRADFARARGWSKSYITKLGQQGKLVFDAAGKMIDVGATVALLAQASDPGKESVRLHNASERQAAPKHVFMDEPPKSAAADPKYWDNKARREGALATMAELDLAKQCGGLVDRESVERTAFAIGRSLRDTMLGLPTRLAPVIASMTDAREVEVLLRDAIRQVFVDAMKMTSDDLARLSDQAH